MIECHLKQSNIWSNKLPVTVNVVLPLGDHQVNSVKVVEIHEAILPLRAIFIRYSEQQINTVYMCQGKGTYMFKNLKKNLVTLSYSR